MFIRNTVYSSSGGASLSTYRHEPAPRSATKPFSVPIAAADNHCTRRTFWSR
jgi:hypothetical protein